MTAFLVIDASVAVKWFVAEVGSEEADALSISGSRLIAPAMIRLEVASALSKKVRRHLLEWTDADRFLRDLPRFFEQFIDHDELLGSAIAMARDLDHPVYDCVYLETARRRDAILVTHDSRLLAKLRSSPYAVLARPLVNASRNFT